MADETANSGWAYAARNQSAMWTHELLERPEWHERAECRGQGVAVFFTERGGNQQRAKETCASCPVTDECLQHAMDNRETFGVWGGLSERQRRTLRKTYKRMVPCDICGTAYHYAHPGMRYCSDRCRNIARVRTNRKHREAS